MKNVQARLERLESDGAMIVQSVDQGTVLPDPSDANLVTRINQLQLRTLSILQRADAAGRADVALKAIREARGNMELLAHLNQISAEVAAAQSGYCAVMSFGDVTVNLVSPGALPGGGVIVECEAIDEAEVRRGRRAQVTFMGRTLLWVGVKSNEIDSTDQAARRCL